MARPLRIEYENAFYHVIARGERRDVIFTCPADKKKFLIKFGETAEKYCLLIQDGIVGLGTVPDSVTLFW